MSSISMFASAAALALVPGLALEKGMNQVSILTVDGTRNGLVYVPESYEPNGEPLPFVLNWHGANSDPVEQVNLSQFLPLADAHNFIVAFPDGTRSDGDVASFNGGGCCPPASQERLDDVGFGEALIDYVAREVNLDQSRVYSTGMSNGGYITYRVACELSSRIAAMVSVTGLLADDPPMDPEPNGGGIGFLCDLAHPMPTMAIHSTRDLTVRYNGTELLGGRGVVESARLFAGLNGVAGQEFTPSFVNTGIECLSVGAGMTNVTYCTHHYFPGHCWPGVLPDGLPELDPYSCPGRDEGLMNASEEIVAFFSDKRICPGGSTEMCIQHCPAAAHKSSRSKCVDTCASAC